MSTQEQLDPVAVAQKLLGREMTSEEIALNFRIKETLGLSDDDAIWTLLSVLGVYLTMYRDMPKEIVETVTKMMAEFKVNITHVTDAAERASIVRTEKNVVEAFEKLVKQAEKSVTTGSAMSQKKKLIAWASAAAFGGVVVASGLLWMGYTLGDSKRQAELAWLDTKEGQAAKRFAQLNNVERMLECPSPQYVVERKDGDFCSPYDMTQKTVRMWRIK